MAHTIRYILLLCLTAFCSPTFCQQLTFFESADTFFRELTQDGKIKYRSILENQESLQDLMDDIATFPAGKTYNDTTKAFLINAYNLIVIHQVVMHYPIKSVMDVPQFFTKKWTVAGENLSLDEIEKRLLAQSKDPRIHLVLNCGAISCPPAANHAYSPLHLESEIISQCRKAITDEQFIRRSQDLDSIQLSKIFLWYENDWGSFAEVQQFVKSFLLDPPATDAHWLYYNYNWQLNEAFTLPASSPQDVSLLRVYTPSRLLRKGQWDIKWFHNIYTETSFVNDGGQKTNVPRQTFYNQSWEIFTSLDASGRWNLGLIASIRSTIRSQTNMQHQSHQAIESLIFPNDGVFSRSGLASIAPSIKYAPFPSIPRFSWQSSFHFPLLRQAESPIFVYFNSYIWENRFFFDQTIGKKEEWQIFTELDLNYTFGDQNDGFANNSLFTPITAIVSYFPTNWATAYLLAQHGPRWGSGAQDYTQVGIGAKFQLTSRVNLELLYNQFVRGTNTGLGRSYNLGLRYIYL